MIPNLDRTFDRVGALAKALSLPFDRDDQLQSVLASTKVPRETLSALRTDAPVAVVAFAPKQENHEPEVVIALMGKSPQMLQDAIASLGNPIASHVDAKQLRIGEDSRWFLRRGGSLVVATSLETLIDGAEMALELAGPGQDDASVWISPMAIARSRGADLKTVLTGVLAATFDSLKPVPNQNPGISKLLQSLLESVVDWVAEVEEATLSLRLDADKGLALRVSATPRKGSTLAAFVGLTKPFALDGRVVPEGPPVLLASFSATDLARSVWRRVRPVVANDKRGEEAASHIDLLTDAWTSGGSSAGSVVDGRLRVSGVYGLRPGVDGPALLSAIERLMTGAWYRGLLAAADSNTRIRVRRDKDALVVSTSTEPAKKLPAAIAKSLENMGLVSQTYAMVVGEDALFYASGDRPADSAHRLMSAPPRKPLGLCAQAAAESAGSDAFLYMDFAPFLNMGLGGTARSADPSTSASSLPFWLSYRGGQAATIELRVPMELARGVAALVPMLMGIGQSLEPQQSEP